MNRVHVGNFGRADHLRNIQVTVAAAGGANAYGLIGESHMQSVTVSFRIDGYRRDPEFPARAQNTKSDFAAIGYENFSEHFTWRANAPFCRARECRTGARRIPPAVHFRRRSLRFHLLRPTQFRSSISWLQ